MKKTLLALCFVCYWVVSIAQEYVITRRMKNASNPSTNNNADRFLLPATLCGESKGATECPLMGGRKIGDCKCACDTKDERNVTYKSTFGFYDGEWKCENNTGLRHNTGCILFPYNSMNDPIPTKSQSHVSFNLMNRLNHRMHCYDLVERRPHENSTYQKCNGTWEGLNRTILEKNFDVHWHFLEGHLFFQSSQLYPLPAGRLIRLVFECRYPRFSMCFLLKVNGNLKCSVPSSETTTFRPSTTAAAQSKSNPSSSSLPTSSTTAAALSKSNPLSSLRPTSSRTNDNLNATTRASSSGTNPSTLIAGSVLGVVAFVTLIAVIIVIARKRYLRKRKTTNQRHQNPVTVDGISLELSCRRESEGDHKMPANIHTTTQRPNLYTERSPASHGEELKKAIQSRLKNIGTDNPGYENTERVDIPSSSVAMQPTYNLPYEYARTKKALRPPTMAPLKGGNERIYDEPHASPKTTKPSYTLPNVDRIYQQLDPSSRREQSEYQTLGFKNETDA